MWARPAGQREHVNLVWLHKLRWAAVAGQLVTIGIVQFGMRIPLPWVWMLVLVSVVAATNVVLGNSLRRSRKSSSGQYRGVPTWCIGVVMLVDNLLLTATLYLSGGPMNPFTIFYLVNIALASVLLESWWAWLLGAASVLCFGLLFIDHFPISGLGHEHHGSGSMNASLHLHLRGMLVAFGIAAGFIVYFVTRVTRELQQREMELIAVRRRESQLDKLDALATLAAGAAHELATPLGTIAVAAHDLHGALQDGAWYDDAIEDVRRICAEVDRCRGILGELAKSGGETTGESFARVPVAEILHVAIGALSEASRVRVDSQVSCDVTCRIPLLAVTQSLRALLQNAIDASPPQENVRVAVTYRGSDVQIAVRDHGMGMCRDVARRVGEPFFTTKEPGRGMGLGLFVARRSMERLGGSVNVESAEGVGTTATICIPCDCDEAG
jgi:two-component system sensor histidine kinase RegB